jgi:hypothetical protein
VVIVVADGMAPVACRLSALSSARCIDNAMRPTLNMSPGNTDSRSTPSDGRDPSFNSRPVIGNPWP